MPWFKVQVAHDRMVKGLIVELKNTADVKRRVERGYLKKVEAPSWSKPSQRASSSTRTEPSP
jgi:hypothetical protein